MATELEQAVKRLNQALENASEEERAEFLGLNQELLDEPEKKAPRSRTRGLKLVFDKITYVLGFVFLFLLRLLIIIVKAPFFIFSFVRNWIVMGLGLWFTWLILVLAHDSFFEGVKYEPILLTDKAAGIIALIACVVALIGTIGQYSGRIDLD